MIVQIDVVSPFTKGQSLTGWEEKAVEVAITALTSGAYNEWMKVATEKLRTTKKVYRQGLSHIVNGTVGELTLTGWLPMMIEFGRPPTDLKELILGGGQPPRISMSRRGKSGPVVPIRYKRIPFRWAVGDATTNLPPLPPEVSEFLNKARRGGGGNIDLMNAYKTINRFTGYQSKVGLYANIRRTRDAVTGAQGPPTSFRTVSDNSDPLSWYQGIDARNFRNSVLEYIRAEAPNMMKAIFQ